MIEYRIIGSILIQLSVVISIKAINTIYKVDNEKVGYDKENIILNGYFSNHSYALNMSYGIFTINANGHTLVEEVRDCTIKGKQFFLICINEVRNKWTPTDHGFQRIPEFYFTEENADKFEYFMSFGHGLRLYEGYKCCIIYEIMDCIHSHYKKKCVPEETQTNIGSFGPIDEVLHVFTMEIHDNCFHYHINNELFNVIIEVESDRSADPKEYKQYKQCEALLKDEKYRISPENSAAFTFSSKFILFSMIFTLLERF